ncbi:hypothetical protein H257_01291 [Aphanomyces astaci]|uniref:Membrane-associated protein n=1 Tax=Aphanomyces astaci TaxID=112090 RepID=W4H8G8_APHAT|nr:hypothetical protein H257_01291 [Aphanomyces astaci]ETV87861.1 hypothetical protein H257_01291 [Aphanomyces astaci]|eukprot:XP_009822724.1 hypothetical protein H257_01291 [Aphanomyces astaci]
MTASAITLRALVLRAMALAFFHAAAVSGDCSACATSGQCATAFNGGAGYFCGNWAETPCCCPDNAVCIPTSLTCQCSPVTDHATFSPVESTSWDASKIRSSGLVAVFVWLTCCFCVYWGCLKRMRQSFVRQHHYVAIPPLHAGANMYSLPFSHAMQYPPQPQVQNQPHHELPQQIAAPTPPLRPDGVDRML